MDSKVTIYNIPADIHCVIFSFTVVRELSITALYDTDFMIRERYRTLNKIVRTCKMFYASCIKLLDPSIEVCFPFRRACNVRDIDTIKYFLKDPRVDINVFNKFCMESMCILRHLDVIETLFADPRYSISKEEGERMLTVCAGANSNKVFEFLISDRVGLDPSCNGNECLIGACMNGSLEVLQCLLKDERVHNRTDFEGLKTCHSFKRNKKRKLETIEDVKNKALRCAIASAHIDTFNELLKNGRFTPDYSALSKASGYGCTLMARKLLPLIDDPNMEGKRAPAIIRATNCGFFQTMAVLLNDPRVDPTIYNNGALLCACRYGSVEGVEALLKTGRVNPMTNIVTLVGQIRFVRYKSKILDLLTKDHEEEFKEKVIQSAELRGYLDTMHMEFWLDDH